MCVRVYLRVQLGLHGISLCVEKKSVSSIFMLEFQLDSFALLAVFINRTFSTSFYLINGFYLVSSDV